MPEPNGVEAEFARAYAAAVAEYKALPPEEQAKTRNPSKARTDLLAGWRLAIRQIVEDRAMRERLGITPPVANGVSEYHKPDPCERCGGPRDRIIAYSACRACKARQQRESRARKARRTAELRMDDGVFV